MRLVEVEFAGFKIPTTKPAHSRSSRPHAHHGASEAGAEGGYFFGSQATESQNHHTVKVASLAPVVWEMVMV